MRNLGTLAIFLTLAAGAVAAQTAIHTAGNRLYDSHIWLQSMVRDKAGNLYLCYTDQFKPPQRDIAVARSTDGGKTWNLKWQTGFAALATTDLGNRAPVMAIDSQENLHLAWDHVGVDDNSWSTSYRRWIAASQSWSKEVSLSAPGRRQRYNCIAIDSKDYVYILRNTGFWQGVLEKSNKPSASDDTFGAFSPALSTSWRFEHMDMIVDALDRVHLSFYNYGSSWSNYHTWIDPGATNPQWSSLFCLGTANSGADFYTSMGADLAGNVCCVYGVEMPGVTSGPDPYVALRKWDGATQAWSNELKVYQTKRSQLSEGGGTNDCAFLAGACDEVTGEFYFTYRDLDTGHFLLARWHDGDPAPTTYAKLMSTGSAPTNALNYFMYPQIRGTVHPYFNRTAFGLDLTYTVGHEAAPTPRYTLYHDSFPIGSLAASGPPRIGTTMKLNLSAVRDANRAYAIAVSATGMRPALPIGRRFIPLAPDPLFYITVQNLLPMIFQNFHGSLSGAGVGLGLLVIPNAAPLVGIRMTAAFVTYPGGPLGIHTISNPLAFTITS